MYKRLKPFASFILHTSTCAEHILLRLFSSISGFGGIFASGSACSAVDACTDPGQFVRAMRRCRAPDVRSLTRRRPTDERSHLYLSRRFTAHVSL